MSFQSLIDNFPLFSWLSDRGYGFRGSTSIRINCPHCGGIRTLSIHTQKKFCQCFRCSEGGHAVGKWDGTGSLIDLVALVEDCDRRTAFKKIAELSGQPDLDFDKLPEIKNPEKFFPKESVLLSKAHHNHPAKKILKERKLEHLTDSIFVCVSGQYANRWILPCLFFNELKGFEAKSYCGKKPKSLFPEWFSTSESFYTTKTWDFSAGLVIITESIFDAETVGCNAIGLYGSQLREGQLLKLVELKDKGVRELIWFLDGDAWRKQRRQVLLYTRNFFANRVVRVPKDEDPNSIGRDACWQLVKLAKVVESGLDFL